MTAPTARTTCADVVVTGSPPEALDAAREGICAAIERMITAWNAADATAYGAQFTENATYVTWIGTLYQGRDDITASHAALFTGLLKGVRLDGGRVVSTDFPNPGTARVVTRTDDGKVQTYLMVDDGGTWKAAAFHNTKRRPVLERLQFLRDPGSVPSHER
jgi:uncharacterized protein (TIGR02246 family)